MSVSATDVSHCLELYMECFWCSIKCAECHMTCEDEKYFWICRRRATFSFMEKVILNRA